MKDLDKRAIGSYIWLAYAGGKTDRYDVFRTIIIGMNPSDEIAEWCHKGLAAETTEGRTEAVEAIMALTDQPLPL